MISGKKRLYQNKHFSRGINFTKVFIFCLTFVFVTVNDARTEILMGRVVNSETLLAVVDANIIVTNTHFGSSSGSEGSFEINGIPPGSYLIEITSLGYEPKKIEISIGPDWSNEVIVIKLISQSIELEPVDIIQYRPTDMVSNENRVSGEVVGQLNVKAKSFQEITEISVLMTLDKLSSKSHKENSEAKKKLKRAKAFVDVYPERAVSILEEIETNYSDNKYFEETLYYLIVMDSSSKVDKRLETFKQLFPDSPYWDKIGGRTP